jgi:UDP-glucose 4-epimerase
MNYENIVIHHKDRYHCLMEKVLVTGASGFLGSWVLRTLDAQRYCVLGLARKQSNLWRISNLPDVRIICENENNWSTIIRTEKPAIVISLDWQGVDNKSHEHQEQFSNISRSLAMAESCLQSGVKEFIGFGSQAEIGPTKEIIFENSTENPTTNYGRAKVELRKRLFEIFDKSQVNFKWVRIFSTYGPLDTALWFIPSAVQELVSRKTFNMTFGEQSWNYLHAYDFAAGICKLIDSNQSSGVFNIGNKHQITILEVSEIIGNYLRLSNAINVGAIPYRDDQAMTLQPDISKMESLGWEPRVPLRAGIESTIDWILGRGDIEITDTRGTKLIFTLPIRH